MLSHFTLKIHQTALKPMKRVFFTRVVIKSDLPIIFLVLLLISSPVEPAAFRGRTRTVTPLLFYADEYDRCSYYSEPGTN